MKIHIPEQQEPEEEKRKSPRFCAHDVFPRVTEHGWTDGSHGGLDSGGVGHLWLHVKRQTTGREEIVYLSVSRERLLELRATIDEMLQTPVVSKEPI